LTNLKQLSTHPDHRSKAVDVVVAALDIEGGIPRDGDPSPVQVRSVVAAAVQDRTDDQPDRRSFSLETVTPTHAGASPKWMTVRQLKPCHV
jgi:hypothetical protein